MRLLDRYILRELLRMTVLTTAVLVTVIAFGAAIKPLANESLLTAGTTMKYIVLAIVPMLQFALPFAAGFAGTISLHRMTSDNEIIAAAVGGISYQRLLVPIAALGLALTLIMSVLTQWVIPRFWAYLERTVAHDITRVFQSSIERGKPFQIGDQQIYADGVIVEAAPANSDIDTRLTLLHVVAAELDADGGIDKDVTASRAIVDVYRRPGFTLVKIAMTDAVAYDPKGGVLAQAKQLESRTIVIPNARNDDLHHKTRGELLALRRIPDGYTSVVKRRMELAEAFRDEEVWTRITAALATDGVVELVSSSEDGARFQVQAASISGGLFVADPGQSVEVIQVRGGRAERRLRSADVRLRRHDPDPLTPVTFDLVLTNCEVTDLAEPSKVNLRKAVTGENLVLAGFDGSDFSEIPSDVLLARVAAADPATRDRLAATAERLIRYLARMQHEVTARLWKRYALSATALLLILLGAVMAMWLRGSLPLTVYLWAFLPSIADLILISSGEHMMRDGNVLHGLAIMWSGNAALLAMLGWAFLKWRDTDLLLIDRHILARFFTNFVILYALLFVFAVAIDLVMALDHFVDATRAIIGEDGGVTAFTITFVKLVVQFQGPRFFQFYAYLHGLVSIGAMGFTLAQMYRHKELVAMLAAGLSMQRIAMPFVVAAFAISAVQLLNQELLLPRVVPLLLRDHGQIGMTSVEKFPVDLTPDANRSLVQSPEFDPRTNVLERPTILRRDERGRTERRITADRARWRDDDDGAAGWVLEGREITLTRADAAGTSAPMLPRPIVLYQTDLSPELLMVQRHGQFAAMLSLRQIASMLATPGVTEADALRRYQYGRFSAVLVNILVMWLALPTFLLREPVNLIQRTIMCAMLSIPCMLGSAIFMVMDLPGIPPALGVLLPVVILIPVVLAQWTFIKT